MPISPRLLQISVIDLSNFSFVVALFIQSLHCWRHFLTFSLEWKAIGDKLQRPYYLSRVDHIWKIRSRRQRTYIGKYFFVNRTIQDWNQLPAEVLRTLPCKLKTLKKRVRKAIIEMS